MKDRVSSQVLTNGAIRYGIYNADGTLNRYEYIKPEDVPTEVGSAYSKVNVLPDATCVGLGISTSSEPKDAFNAIPVLIATGDKYVKLLETISGAATSAVTLDFSGIDMTQYNALEVYCEYSTASNGSIKILINGATSGYFYVNVSGSLTTVADRIGEMYGRGSADGPNSGKIEICYNPSITTSQTVLARTISASGVSSIPGNSVVTDTKGGRVTSLSAGVTSITIASGAGDIQVGSKFTVYGVKK